METKMEKAQLEYLLIGSDRSGDRRQGVRQTGGSDRESYRRYLAETSEATKPEERDALSKWVKDRERQDERERTRSVASALHGGRPGREN